MKYILICLFLLLQGETLAQSYSCISQEPKTYFTNSRGYLRGMRIDSVRSEGGNTVYYPFKTARIGAHAFGTHADTNGGSWLGGMLIESSDGFTYIPNNWGDTVSIKNNALLHDSWVMYQDSSPLYYLATVTAVDTMTIGNVLDSIKTISLTAMEGGNIVADTLNNLEIMLSKNNGLWQAIDFYLFPYKDTLSQAYNRSIDYYLNESMRPYVLFSGQDLAYRRVNYVPAMQQNIFNYEVGDIIITVTRNDLQIPEVHHSVWDTITAKTISGDSVVYNIDSHYAGLKRKTSGPPGLEHYSGYGVRTLYVTNELLIDTTWMPEEWHNPDFHYFWESDSSFCYPSRKYTHANTFLTNSGQLYGFEQSRNPTAYKEGLGMVSQSYTHFPTEAYLSIYIKGAKKEGVFCGEDSQPLSIDEEYQIPEARLRIYPNPATNKVTVAADQNQPFTVSVITILGGATGIKSNSKGGQAMLSLSDLPAGVYLLSIDMKGKRAFRKILVQR